MAVGSSSWQGRNFKGLIRFHTADQSTLMTKLLLTLDLNSVPEIIIHLLNVNIVILKAKIRPTLNKEVFQDFIVDLTIVSYKVGGELLPLMFPLVVVTSSSVNLQAVYHTNQCIQNFNSRRCRVHRACSFRWRSASLSSQLLLLSACILFPEDFKTLNVS